MSVVKRTLERSLLPAIRELERAYRFFNRELFCGDLPEDVYITIQTRGKHLAYGWLWARKWRNGGQAVTELNIAAETLAPHLNDAYKTLLHEMVHYWNLVQGIQDCSRGSTYHNARFKEAAEAVGLVVERSPQYGWVHTTLGPKARRALRKLRPRRRVFDAFRTDDPRETGRGRNGKGGGHLKGKSTLKKWRCGCTNIRAAVEVKAKCLKCGEQFERQGD